MRKNYFVKIAFFFFLILSQFSFSQIYYVNTQKLNVRESGNKNAYVLFQLEKGAEVNVIESNGNWVKINYEEKTGFVNKKYLSENISTINVKTETQEKGFKYGFNKAFTKTGIFILCICWFLIYVLIGGQVRVKDGRFSSGYRQLPLDNRKAFKAFLVSGLITLVISTFVGICFWIVKLFE